jgi:hypothetical protein
MSRSSRSAPDRVASEARNSSMYFRVLGGVEVAPHLVGGPHRALEAEVCPVVGLFL